MNIKAKLTAWENAALITSGQKEQILSFENARKRPFLYYTFLFISCMCIGTGIISVIAYNWENISDFAKLFCYFILLAATGTAVFQSRIKEKTLAFESLSLLFAAMVMAGIGLIAQVYDLRAENLRAVLLWSVITLPLMLLCRKPFLAGLWLFGFSAAFYAELINIEAIQEFMEKALRNAPFWLFWADLLIKLAILRVLYAFKLTGQLAKAGRFWFYVCFAFYILNMELSGLFFGSAYPYFTTLPASLSPWLYWLPGLAAFGILWWFCRRDEKYSLFLTAMLAAAVYSIIRTYTSGSETFAEILSAALTIFVLLACQIYAYRGGWIKTMNFCAALIALRFFIIYLQVFGSMLDTGIGLIISGLVFLAIALSLHKVSSFLTRNLKKEA